MGDKSAIEWTDASWNPVTGCTKVSPGCAHCYAERVAVRLWPKQYPPVEVRDPDCSAPIGAHASCTSTRPREFTDVQCHQDRLDQPLRWKKPRKIFVNSMSDLFHEAVPDAFIDRVFAVMALASQHAFQILTKRAERMRDYLTERVTFHGTNWPAAHWRITLDNNVRDGGHRQVAEEDWPLLNVWLGVSVENQHFANERIPLLLQTPAAVRFISAEPLLGDLDLTPWLDDVNAPLGTPFLDWVIVGGESGPGARPCCLSWIRNIVHDCAGPGVPLLS